MSTYKAVKTIRVYVLCPQCKYGVWHAYLRSKEQRCDSICACCILVGTRIEELANHSLVPILWMWMAHGVMLTLPMNPQHNHNTNVPDNVHQRCATQSMHIPFHAAPCCLCCAVHTISFHVVPSHSMKLLFTPCCAMPHLFHLMSCITYAYHSHSMQFRSFHAMPMHVTMIMKCQQPYHRILHCVRPHILSNKS